MKCPICKGTLVNDSYCPNCRVDVVLYKKTIDASNKLYNKGLELAKMSDFSGAVEALSQSVIFHKRNYRARNLLGICYYETGRVADALMHWIISSSLRKDNNPAKSYIDSLQNSTRALDKYNDAIRMYNQAIIYLEQKSEDLAIIQLKKAVDFSPKLVEAWNLLAFCYIINQDIGKANDCINKVLAIDINNSKALNYSYELNAKKPKNAGKQKKEETDNDVLRTPNKNAAPFRYPEKKASVIGKTEVIAFIVGIVCTAAVLMTLIIPAWVDEKDKKISDLEGKLAKVGGENVLSTGVSYEELLNENKRLNEEIDQYKQAEILQEKQTKIDQALALFNEGNFEDSVLLIADIDINGLSEDYTAKYNTVKENGYSKAAEGFYNLGKSQYLNSKYDDAMVNFENSLKFASNEVFVDDIYYYMGKIYENKEDKDKAKEYYQKVITEYPDSNQFKNAENSLNALQ